MNREGITINDMQAQLKENDMMDSKVLYDLTISENKFLGNVRNS